MIYIIKKGGLICNYDICTILNDMNNYAKSIVESFLLSLLLCFFSIHAVAKGKFSNPLHTTTGDILCVADPCVYESGGVYYLSASSEGGFDYYTSRDLMTWEYQGVLFRVPDDEPIKTMLWASEVAEHNGIYYLTYSGWDPRAQRLNICLATATRPEGPFTLQYSPWISHPKRNVIDANLFWDTDDTPYVYLSENGVFEGYCGGELRMARLKQDMSALATELVPVCMERQPWEMHMKEPNDYCNEGPEVFLCRGTYYMVYSANETHNGYYGMGVMTAPTAMGPWTKADYNPIMQTDFNGLLTEYGIPAFSSPGHCGLVLNSKHTGGYMLYHRHAPWVHAYPSNDRITCIARFRIHKGKLLITNNPIRKLIP